MKNPAISCMFETPAMIWISLRTDGKRKALPVWKQLLAAVGIGVAGVAFVGAASGLSLLLNGITDEWFACIAFAVLWVLVLVIEIMAVIRGRLRIRHFKRWDVPGLIYWLAMYGFCIAALLHLGIAAEKPLYFVFGLVLGIGTLVLVALGKTEGVDGNASVQRS